MPDNTIRLELSADQVRQLHSQLSGVPEGAGAAVHIMGAIDLTPAGDVQYAQLQADVNVPAGDWVIKASVSAQIQVQ